MEHRLDRSGVTVDGDDSTTLLIGHFQDNVGNPVPERLHSGFYSS